MVLQDCSGLRRAAEEMATVGLLQIFRKAGTHVVTDEKTVLHFYFTSVPTGSLLFYFLNTNREGS